MNHSLAWVKRITPGMRILLFILIITSCVPLLAQDTSLQPKPAHRNSISINFDLLTNSATNDAPYYFTSPYGVEVAAYSNTSHAPNYQRALSLTYNRQLFHSLPFLLGQINGAFTSFDVVKEAELNAFSPDFLRYPAREQIAISMLYLDPGLEVHIGRQGRIQVFAGGGLTFAFALRSYRRMEQTDPNNMMPRSPAIQIIENFIAPERGHYYHVGIGGKVTNRLSLLFRLRWYRLRESINVDPSAILQSSQFRKTPIAAPEERKQLQFQLQYAW